MSLVRAALAAATTAIFALTPFTIAAAHADPDEMVCPADAPICVTLSEDDVPAAVVVEFDDVNHQFTWYNIRWGAPGKFDESQQQISTPIGVYHGVWRLPGPEWEDITYVVKVQGCSIGDFELSSDCSPWTTATIHTKKRQPMKLPPGVCPAPWPLMWQRCEPPPRQP